ncbi:MAG: biotin/lipoyl-containing protein [Peptostreptococcaceae bacterium]
MSTKTYHITLNGKVYEVQIEDVTELKPENKASEPVKLTSAPTITKNSIGESITAPMPGTILNILVKEGEKVKKGQVLAVLEAMKMENEIVAPVDGEIASITVGKGQNVNLGDSLLKIA